MPFLGKSPGVSVVTVSDGAITAAKLADDAVTSAKIADDAVVTASIADDAITSALIADNAVVTASIADSAVTSAKTDGVTGANPNLIINGSMKIGQRDALTGQSGTNSSYGGVDRWYNEIRNVGTYSVSQSTSVVPEGFSHSLEVKCTTADASLDANSYGHLTYKFEGQDVQVFKKGTSSAIAFALSFWVRSSKTGTYVARLRDNTNARYFSKNYTISSANTWEYKTVVFAADTTGAIANNTSSGMSLYFWYSGGTDYTSGSAMTDWATSGTLAPSQVNLSDTVNATFYLTGVKLEAASACTAYEHPDYTTELKKCFRYYQKITNAAGFSMLGVASSTNTAYFDLYYERKRVNPSFGLPTASVTGNGVVPLTAGGSYPSDATGTLTALKIGKTSCRLDAESFGGLTDDGPSWLYWVAENSIEVNAEL